MIISETELISSVVGSLTARLPRGWETRLDPDARLDPRTRRFDGMLTIVPPSGPPTSLAIIARANLGWNELTRSIDRDVRVARAQANGVLVVAPYVSPTARRRLIDQDTNFADQTGNVWISLPQPPLFIELRGADRNPDQVTRSLHSLRGRAAARAIRGLCDFKPPYGILDLAERARVSAPSVSRVVDLLEREQLLARASQRGEIVDVAVRGVIERWVKDYEFSKANATALYLEPRGIPTLAGKLRETNVQYAVTGSVAVSLIAPSAPVRLASLYVTTLADAEALELRKVSAGGNVILAVPFDPIVFERTMVREGLSLAGPSQIAADLLTGPGRSPGEGEELLTWMEANEDDWRL